VALSIDRWGRGDIISTLEPIGAISVQAFPGKRGKTGGGMNLRFTGGHESDSFWECCRPPTSMAYRMPI
jgi:hypothetical protein